MWTMEPIVERVEDRGDRSTWYALDVDAFLADADVSPTIRTHVRAFGPPAGRPFYVSIEPSCPQCDNAMDRECPMCGGDGGNERYGFAVPRRAPAPAWWVAAVRRWETTR